MSKLLTCSYCKNASANCVLCTCKLSLYCSAKCQVADWPSHKSFCRKNSSKYLQWIDKINNYFKNVKTDTSGRQGIWQDAYIEYKTIKKRGVVVTDITEEIKPEIANDKKSASASANANTMYDPRHAAINNASASVWHYFPHDDEKFVENKNGSYTTLLKLMDSYNPEKQFVLMAFCSDPDEKKMCHMEEIINKD